MTKLRWLHFTDLHIGQKEFDKGYWSSIRGAVHEDLERTTRALGPWDLVVFTGDLVYSGTATQFEALDEELNAIWRIFAKVHPDATPPVLLAVPGNHDLVRPTDADPYPDQLLDEKKDKGREALWENKPTHVGAVSGWFAAYAKWWEHSKLRPSKGFTPGLLPGDFAYTFDKEGLRIGFLGLNVAYLHVTNGVRQKLRVDPRQVMGACSGDIRRWVEGHQAAFLLTHHPPEWLHPEAQEALRERIAPAGLFTAHLCGHLHDSLASQTSAGRGAVQEMWQGAALFGIEHLPDTKGDRKHGYTAGELCVEGGVATTRLWPRLGVKRHDGSWAITADVTYHLQGDLLATPAAPATGTRNLPRSDAEAHDGAGSSALPSWREAVEVWPHWPTGGDAEARNRCRRLAADIAALCWEQWEAATRDLPGDPWRDEDLPRRQLQRLAALVPPGKLNAHETALLLAAPFLREALFAAGACWMSGARPLIVPAPDPDHPARKVLENVHAARPALVRRMEKEAANSPVRAAVGFWLMTQALRQCPQLWEAETDIPHAHVLGQRAEAALGRAGAGFPPLARLMQLVRHLGFGAEVFQTEGRIDRDGVVEPDGVRVDLRVLARLLCAAGSWALDLRLASDLVADHAGREGFTPSLAIDTLRAARWIPAPDVHHLRVKDCPDSVVDFLLRDDLVPRAERVIERLRQDRAANPSLWPGDLPTHLRHEISVLPGPDGRPRYQVPHVRFQLDHNQVRELLMGVQLYGDPSLAIRELYQNALDACRYRRARAEFRPQISPYDGRIEIRQGFDTDGRAYIECEDNGVGMDAAIVEQVFAVAGRRFQDTPEFVEEAARWKTSGRHVELSPNSRFGIGVLSYFMLADELEIHTRRYLPTGALSKALVVRISSAGGLFRMQEGEDDVMPNGGTRVRLYLSSTTYVIKDLSGAQLIEEVSCQRTLGELLWVAEFATTVSETGKDPLRWQPGWPSPRGKAAAPAEFLATGDPNVWWAAWTKPVEDIRNASSFPLLVDGIATRSSTQSMLVNLPRARCSELSVDRQKVLAWDQAWAESELRASIPQLLGWEGLTVAFLWCLDDVHPVLGELVVAAICEKGYRPPIALVSSDSDVGGPRHTADVRALGCFPADVAFFAERAGENLLSAWRASNWIATGGMSPQRRWPSRDHINALPSFPMHRGDLDILGMAKLERRGPFGRPYEHYRRHLVIDAIDVAREALLQGRSVADILNRAEAYSVFGFEVDLGEADVPALEGLRCRRDELSGVMRLVSRHHGSQCVLTPIEVVSYSFDTFQTVSTTLDLLGALGAAGLPVVVQHAETLAGLGERKEDRLLLSRDMDGRPPWLRGPVPPHNIRLAAKKLGVSTDEVVARLRQYEFLGPKVPDYQAERWDSLSPADWELLEPSVEHEEVPDEYAGTVLHLLDISQTSRLTLGEARSRLEELTWTGLTLLQLDAAALDQLAAEEPRLRDVAPYFGHDSVTAVSLAEAAGAADGFATAARVASRLQILPEALQRAVASLSVRVDDDTITLLRAYESAPGADRATRKRRGYATARFKVWQPSEEELKAKLAELAPLIEYILDQPPVS